MIIVRTPFRISFAGGGSDIGEFYRKHPGAVLSTTINKYMYICVHPYFYGDTIFIKYSKTERVKDIEEIEHKIFKQVLKDFNIKGGIEITSISDIPAGTGLGSSSAFTVGLIHTLYSYKNVFVSKEKMAREASITEIDKLGEPIGKQDQYASAYGGLNFIRFNTDDSVRVDPIIAKPQVYEELQNRLLMFYTGDTRAAGTILTEQKRNISKEEQFKNVIKMTELAHELKTVLEKDRLDKFGEILNEGWKLKKSLAGGITNEAIDEYYNAGILAGASGGKLLGAGGGGFLLFYCKPESQSKVRAALNSLRELRFGFDTEGSKVIYYNNTSNRLE